MPLRLVQLFAGLVLYGVSSSMLLLAGLGVDPWDVLHQGLARWTGIPTGTWAIIVGALVLLLWIPLRQRPGLGTLCNVVMVGLFIDIGLAVLPVPVTVPVQVAYLVVAIAMNAAATALYVGARLGPGPRDGLMTGLAAKGLSVRVARTAIEVVVVVAGYLLGGRLGWGTLAYAVLIGPLVQVMLPWFAFRATATPPPVALPGESAA